ncbi:histone acetyltransferase subunit NuA4-domain-containing protein [Syncephalis pseudoplumigaleata]|uniref:Chromatin modification-related protein EAF6 n=1 Tax=Syncephalis pseudoplumigaleata TaxID=1712513 RepID=A0A4P9Z5Z6_9FUNG|nr:histone acetyltransferase subunit NuA4-domain-containing protein [Syncephalis pseudoplumigaleata]|eukprot:RKP28073.1 histone acetyltransferase subunit NuA4-domain-containing protein [Syncephalis pseudoplumigaleata]
MPESAANDANANSAHDSARKVGRTGDRRWRCLCLPQPKNAADYPQLKELEKELVELLARKKQVDRSLANVEVMLYQFEGSYLQESAHGNIVRGFDQYLQSRPTGAATTTGTRGRHGAGGHAGRITESERIFSHSSTTYRRAVGLADEDDYASTSAVPAHPSSPSSSDERAGLGTVTVGVDGSGLRRTSSTHARASTVTAAAAAAAHVALGGHVTPFTTGDDVDESMGVGSGHASHRTTKRMRLSTNGRSGGVLADSEEELDV